MLGTHDTEPATLQNLGLRLKYESAVPGEAFPRGTKPGTVSENIALWCNWPTDGASPIPVIWDWPSAEAVEASGSSLFTVVAFLIGKPKILEMREGI
jgi:hypothetical protein